MLGTVFHYAVVEPEDDHARCAAQVAGIIAMHERMGYRKGGAYNGHFCQHGGIWVSYTGPNQATGDTWANLNLHAWCYLATVGTPVTPAAAQAAYDLTLFEPSGRDQIYPHSAFYATSCCGDPLRDWIAAGARPPAQAPTPPKRRHHGMTILWINYLGIHAYLVGGDLTIIHQFNGPGNPQFGLPQDALDYNAATGCGLVQMTGDEWMRLLKKNGLA